LPIEIRQLAWRVLKRVLQLLALLVAGVLAAALVGFYSDNFESMVPGRWVGWAGMTILLCVFIIRDHRRSWGRLSFWLTLTGLFAVHTALYAIVFRQVSVWRGTWFTLISLPEYLIFLLALLWLGYGDIGRTSRPRHQRE
jgi:hypothetical protein